MLAVGDRAPEFEVVDQNSESFTLAELLGKWTVLWWYPIAGTPG